MGQAESKQRPELEKRVIRKADGRYLILYSRPAADPLKQPPKRRRGK